MGDYNSLLQVKRFIVLLEWLDSSNCEGFSILVFALDSNSQHVRTSTKSYDSKKITDILSELLL